MRLPGPTSLPPLLLLLLLLLLLCAGFSAGGRLTGLAADWNTLQLKLELEPDSVVEPPSVVDRIPADQVCSILASCNVTCTLADLEVVDISSSKHFACPKPDVLTITVEASSADAVLRLRLDAASQLAANESLTVLEDGGDTLAVLTESQETWVASQQPELTLEYQQSDDPDSQIQLTLVAYNQTQESHIFTTEMTGVLDAPEQTNWTGSPDYAVNTEQYWHLNLLETASHVNFTVTNLDLDPAAGDVLIIGSGKGPYDTEPTAELLTGKFPRRRYHVSGGEAFVYFMSRAHATPRTQFEISYTAEPIVGPTTTVPTTTDRDHPPTPSNVDFQLPCYVTGIDPRRFLDPNDTATDDLQTTLASWADYYRLEHGIPSWRPVHEDDIQFSAWLMCDYASGWVKSDPNCVRVTWYIELLRNNGDWAFLESDLRGLIIECGDDINEHLGYQFSLTLDEVNKTWWWVIAIALVPIALIAFLVFMWMSSNSTKLRSNFDENASLADLDELNDEHQNNIDKEVRTITEKDPQLRNLFPDDNIEEYDPELQGAHRRRGLQARFSQQPPAPLKSALKAPKTVPTTYTNAAFEGDNGGRDGGVRTSFLPEEPSTLTTPAAPAAALPAEPASAELTEQLRLLNELNKTLKEDQQQAPGFELPRVDHLVQPAAVAEPKLYSMNEDGTGTEIDAARPGENILQLDNDGGSGENRKTSSV